MALSKKEKEEQESIRRNEVRMLQEENLNLMSRLKLMMQVRAAKKEEVNLEKELRSIGRKGLIEANKYSKVTREIKQLEKELIDAKKSGNSQTVRFTQQALESEKKRQAELKRTAGGSLRAMQEEAAKRREGLTAEKKLVDDINKKRAEGNKLGRIGVLVSDLFRTKEQKQRAIDIARAKVGGGSNQPPGSGRGAAPGLGAGGGKGGGSTVTALAGLGTVGLIAAALYTAFEKLKAPIKAIGEAIKSGITSPLKEVSNLVSGGIGGGYGIGGGTVSGGGATSILGGFQSIVSTLPLVGPALGAVVGVLKGVVDLVLGIDQGITNYARNLGISKAQAAASKEQFIQIRNTTDSIVVNETRLMETQVELSKALGVRSQFSRDILENNVKLKEIAGLELETRKAIAQQSILQGKGADSLTKSILAQNKAFEFETGIAFDFRETLSQTVKLAGVLGLSFSKYPEKLSKSLLITKAMGFEMKQLDDMASSFLDFESSISKEMEAQVLTGRQLNLTTAREAALNNDLVTLAREITSQVGSANEFLSMNRIQQEAIAGAVGMSRDGLADVLKQQEYYKRLGATNIKQATEELELMKKKGMTQAEISKLIGEDAYNYITQTSTAERLTEVMSRIKTVFVEFVEKSGILDFITNPQKIQAFAQGLIERLAGAVQLIGDIISALIRGVGSLPFTDKNKWEGLARSVEAGTSGFAGGLRSTAATLGGMSLSDGGGVAVNAAANNYGETTPSLGTTIQQNQKQQAPTTLQSTGVANTPTINVAIAPSNVYMDGQKVGEIVYGNAKVIQGLNKK